MNRRPYRSFLVAAGRNGGSARGRNPLISALAAVALMLLAGAMIAMPAGAAQTDPENGPSAAPVAPLNTQAARCTVPKLAGKTLGQAKAALSAGPVGLKLAAKPKSHRH
jgi:hypothetical protein